MSLGPDDLAAVRAIVREQLEALTAAPEFARRVSELVGLKPLADLPRRENDPDA